MVFDSAQTDIYEIKTFSIRDVTLSGVEVLSTR